jgi:hypothetical protein
LETSAASSRVFGAAVRVADRAPTTRPLVIEVIR